ncbi:MAG: hypothetical protein ACJ77E_18685 [Gaiellaceae bacterium]
MILSTSAGLSGRLFAHLFARRIDVRRALSEAVRLRLADRNLTDAERSRVARLAEHGIVARTSLRELR